MDFSILQSSLQAVVTNLAALQQTLAAGLPQISFPIPTNKGGTGTVNGVPSVLGFGTANGATVAANTTIYLGNFGANATEATVALPMPFSGTIRNLFAASSAAAGAAQTFTYTLRKNGVAQAVTTTITGASQVANNDTTHSVSFVAGDTIDVQLVTTAGATAAAHALSVEVDKT